MSNEFIAFCKKEGIKKETIVPYTPEQNGLAERKKRSILEVARAMLHDQKVPKFLWVEVTHVVVYVQNRLPHQALEKNAPEEIFTGVKPDISHFRVFGCLVYFHVPKDKRNKLEATGRKGMLVGYYEKLKTLKHTEYIFLVKGRLKLAGT